MRIECRLGLRGARQRQCDAHLLAHLFDAVSERCHVILEQSTDVANAKAVGHRGLSRVD